MADLGIRNYRFSLSWPRLLPEGCGAVNHPGIDFYNRLIDLLLEYGIRPLVTLFHWDYPSALQAKGAWENPDSAKWFADYAALCARSFGDRVKDFITFNEPQCFIGLGYDSGRTRARSTASRIQHRSNEPSCAAGTRHGRTAPAGIFPRLPCRLRPLWEPLHSRKRFPSRRGGGAQGVFRHA